MCGSCAVVPKSWSACVLADGMSQTKQDGQKSVCARVCVCCLLAASKYALYHAVSTDGTRAVAKTRLLWFSLQMRRRLMLALALCIVFMIVEFVGGIYANRCARACELPQVRTAAPHALNFVSQVP